MGAVALQFKYTSSVARHDSAYHVLDSMEFTPKNELNTVVSGSVYASRTDFINKYAKGGEYTFTFTYKLTGDSRTQTEFSQACQDQLKLLLNGEDTHGSFTRGKEQIDLDQRGWVRRF